MQKNKEKDFDAFIQKRIKEEGLENPSIDFTTSVLRKVALNSAQSPTLVYKPLISKSAWYTMAVVLVVILCFVVFGNLNLEVSWLPQITLQKLGELDFMGRLPKIAISDTYVYACIGLAFFMGIQVYLLKNHFEKRYF